MSVLQSVGFAYGVTVVALVPVAVLVLLVPSWRRRLVTGPLRRLAARRRPPATLRYTLPYTRPPE